MFFYDKYFTAPAFKSTYAYAYSHSHFCIELVTHFPFMNDLLFFVLSSYIVEDDRSYLVDS